VIEPGWFELMAELHISTTYGGETLSLATAIAAIDHYRAIRLHEHLGALGSLFRDRVNQRAAAAGLPAVVRGYPQIPWLVLDSDPDAHRARARQLQAAAAERGVLIGERVNFVNAAQDEALILDVTDRIGAALDEVCRTW
jgi:glutamate-1-semialdehyde 2,1-aminomutase